jgi:uncharacterized protein (DUF1697 family)
MDALRSLLEGLGHRDVRTYVQSGNAVFAHRAARPATLANAIEAGLRAELGLDVRVIVRSSEELARAAAASPFAADEPDEAKVHVAFLSAVPADPHALDRDRAAVAPDRFALVGSELHLHYPNGAGRSKLTNALVEKRLGVVATARNLRTVRALVALAAG